MLPNDSELGKAKRGQVHIKSLARINGPVPDLPICPLFWLAHRELPRKVYNTDVLPNDSELDLEFRQCCLQFCYAHVRNLGSVELKESQALEILEFLEARIREFCVDYP